MLKARQHWPRGLQHRPPHNAGIPPDASVASVRFDPPHSIHGSATPWLPAVIACGIQTFSTALSERQFWKSLYPLREQVRLMSRLSSSFRARSGAGSAASRLKKEKADPSGPPPASKILRGFLRPCHLPHWRRRWPAGPSSARSGHPAPGASGWCRSSSHTTAPAARR